MRKLSKALAVIFCMLMLLSSVGAVSLAASKNPAATKKFSTTVSSTAIKLTWSKVSGATGYRVYQYKSGEWAVVKKSTTGNTYTAKSLKPATSYKFAVKTYKKSGSKVYWSAAKKITVKTAAVSNTKTLKATAQENCKIKLSWSKVSNAGGYVVYIYKDGAWKKLKSTTSTSYTVSNLDAKTTYKFKVTTYMKVSGKYYYSSGKTVSVKTSALSVGNITEVDVGVTSDSVTLTWAGNGNIKGYRVYMYNNETKKYDTLKTLSDTTYTATGLSGSTEYTFVVRPYAKSGSTAVWGDKYTLKAMTLLSTPNSISATVDGQTATVTWSPVNNADGYRVYLYNKSKDTYSVLLSSTTETSYTYTIPEKTIQQIGVKAYRKNGTDYDWSSIKEITVGATQYYKNIFASGQYSFTSVIDGYETEIYHKNGSVQVKTTMPIAEGLNADCKIIYNKEKDKSIALMTIAGFGGFYCSDIEEIAGTEIDITTVDAHNGRFVNSTISSEIIVAEIVYSDKILISETHINSDGNTEVYYLQNGEIVKHDIIKADGAVDSVSISNVKSSVSDSKFSVTPPLGYINIDMFL